ncbi:MAG: ATP-binding protein [Bacteroidales bacterium]|nr:ATP-binding protein [Bacteroidales bacterium]MBQ8071135.1 ATP-binding protein [Bacteroidales bacterium]
MEYPERVFKRKIYEKLVDWKRSKDGSTALLIRGARRVGKSTIAEEFAKREYTSYIKVDFADAPDAVWEAVAHIADRDQFFLQLQFIYNVRLEPRKSVIIFDEIQKAPKVREAIKYLVKDHRYDYIETGSLLSIKKNTQGIVIPSEETRIDMFPMDYEEFRWALGDTATVPLLKQTFDDKKGVGDATCRKLLRDFRLYMLVGGMPQAVNAYLDTQNLSVVDSVKREIIDLYADDFRKIDPTGRATRLFMAAPSQLTGNATRYQVTSVLGHSQEEADMNELIQDMEDSMAVNFSYHADNPSVGLSQHKNMQQYKMFVGDTGLFVTMAFWDNEVTENIIYQKLLSDKLASDLGYVYENVIAQMLRAKGDKLYYHTWPTPSGKHNYEIDFLLSRGFKLCPIEVKSSGYKAHVSMDEFCKKFSQQIGSKYLAYTKDLRKDEDLWLIPVYLTLFV